MAIGISLTIALGFIPFFTILLWRLSLPGRRYLIALDGKSQKESVTVEFDDFEGVCDSTLEEEQQEDDVDVEQEA